MNTLFRRTSSAICARCSLAKAARQSLLTQAPRRHLTQATATTVPMRHARLTLPRILVAWQSTTTPASDVQKRLDEFQDLFVEARLCIEDATDSAGTKYFEEDAEAAMEAVKEAVDCFEQIVNGIEDVDEKNRILRSNGLKVEQLKGELEMMLHGGNDH